ncbi:MAG TPA: hypothetical protein VGM64_07450 [Lacunisphaera sp.]|jgi:hypothetical protein
MTRDCVLMLERGVATVDRDSGISVRPRDGDSLLILGAGVGV